jgi:U3 small nucleolar RNA-associated protein 20
LLVKNLFRYSSEKRLQAFATDLKQWMEQDDNAGLKRLGIQCFGFYFETMDEDEPAKEINYVLEILDSVIDECLARRGEDDWELLYYALTLFAKMCKSFPEIMFSGNRSGLWTAVEASSTFPHAWVKMKAAELLGTFFAHLGITNKDTGLEALPLVGSGGLQLAEQNMLQLTHAMFKNLLNQEVTEQLCMQSVKNLAFLARCFAVNGARWNWQRAGDDEEQEEEDETATKSNGDAEVSDDEFSGFSPPPEPTPKKATPATTPPPLAFHRLMIRLSGIVRRDNRSMHTKLSSISLLETIASKFPLPPLSTSLLHLLTTLNTLVDPATTIPRAHTQATSLNEPNEQYKALIDKAREIMSVLQKRMGTQDYLDVMQNVQQGIRERRDERRMKRRLDAVADPEKSILQKKRKHDHMKVKRKERGAEHRGIRRGW